MTGDSRRVGGDDLRDRRQELVEAGVRSIAECGFEGLRLRIVAADVGIDHSTVHHYWIVGGGIGRRCGVQVLLKPGVNDVLGSNAIAQEETAWTDTA